MSTSKQGFHEGLLTLVTRVARARHISLTPDQLKDDPEAVLAALTAAGVADEPIGVAILRSAHALANYFAVLGPLIDDDPERFSLPAFLPALVGASIELGEARGMLLAAHMEMFELAAVGKLRRVIGQRTSAKTAEIQRQRKSERLVLIDEIIAARPTLKLKDVANHLRSELNRMGKVVPGDRTIADEISMVRKSRQRKSAT